MLEIAVLILIFMILIVVCVSMLINRLTKDMPECNGSCYQGRQPCTCKKVDKNGI